MRWFASVTGVCVLLACTSVGRADQRQKPTFTTGAVQNQAPSHYSAGSRSTDSTKLITDSSSLFTNGSDSAASAMRLSHPSVETLSDQGVFLRTMPQNPDIDQSMFDTRLSEIQNDGLRGEFCGDPEAGSCLEEHETPHCDDEACCEKLCYEYGMSWCCDNEWDSDCASVARQYCDYPAPTSACCYGDQCVETDEVSCVLDGGQYFNTSHCDDGSFFCPGCSEEDTLYGQSVVGWGGFFAAISDLDSDAYQRFDRFENVQGDICGVKWVGTTANSFDWTCYEDPMTFEISFYRENGYNQPSSEVYSYTTTVSANVIRDEFVWNQYEVQFDTCITLSEGFISIKGTGGPECMFVWPQGYGGDGSNCYWDHDAEAWVCLPPGDSLAFDHNFCLLGTPYPGACCDEVSGTCSDEVEADDCNGRFAPGKTCAQMEPTCGQLSGACCIDEDPYCYIAAEVDCEGTYAGHGTTCDPTDCNANGRPDGCDIASGVSEDCNDNGIPDECDIVAGEEDYDENGIPDLCESDCNNNGVVDACDIDCYVGACSTHPTGCGQSLDCQPNGVPDECERGDAGDPLLWDNGLPNGEAFLRSFVGGVFRDALTVDDIELPDGGRINAVHWYTEEDAEFEYQGRVHLAIFADNGNSGPSDQDEILSMWIPDDGGTVVRSVLGEGAAYPVRYRYDIYGIDIPLEPGIWWLGLAPEGRDGPNINSSRWCASRSGAAVAMGETHYRAPGYAGRLILFQPWSTASGGSATDAAFSVTTSVFGADCNANGIPDDCDIADCDGSTWCQDCQGNGIPDGCEADCNNNSIPDQCDVLFCDGSSWCGDCNYNEIPDECDVPPLGTLPDCNDNGTPDSCDLTSGYSPDCNANVVPDECDVASGYSDDYDANGNPDECDADCNRNGKVDVCDLSCSVGACASHPLGCETSDDCQPDDIPDECQLLFETEYRTDDGDMDNTTGLASGGTMAWLNHFTIDDGYDTIGSISLEWGDVADGRSCTVYLWSDPNGDEKPGDAQVLASAVTVTANADTGIFTTVDIPDTYVGPAGTSFFVGAVIDHPAGEHPAALDYQGWGAGWIAGATSSNLDPNNLGAEGTSLERYTTSWLIRAVGVNNNDCNQSYMPDECDIATGFSQDCDVNGMPDECEWLDCDGNSVHDPCDILTCDGSTWCGDCNGNGIPDTCDLSSGVSNDCQSNAIPDECEDDCDGNEIPDDCDIRDCDGSLWCEDCNVNGVPDGCESGPGSLGPYQWDDGSSETSIGVGEDVEIAWIQRFTTRSSSDTITAVATSFGSPPMIPGMPGVSGVAAGDAVTVYVWADLFGTGNPNDAILLASAASTIDAASIDSWVLQEIPIGPVTVSGSFFVGAMVYSTAYPAPADTDGTFANESWVASQQMFFGGFNPEGFSAQSMDSIGYSANFLLRAVVSSGPLATDCNENYIPDECELCGDLDSDDDVDYYDYEIFLDAFGGETDYSPAVDWCCDYDKSGAVGMADFAAWLECYRDYVGDPEAGAPSKPELDRPRRFTPVDNRQLVSPTQSATQSLQSTTRTLRK